MRAGLLQGDGQVNLSSHHTFLMSVLSSEPPALCRLHRRRPPCQHWCHRGRSNRRRRHRFAWDFGPL